MINLQHILHVCYERRIGIRRDDPLLLQVRLESVFLASIPGLAKADRLVGVAATTGLTPLRGKYAR
jgi:hypothetical protein